MGHPHLCTEPPACPGERHAKCLLTGALRGVGQAWLWNLVTYATELSKAYHLKHYCSSVTLNEWGGVGGDRERKVYLFELS